ncbi:hypothetical protein [Billgrantia antri]|uniref:Dienelactone hydrolase domain-containing protein n=1 Tax=Billgrantia antri TaxID=2846777 RepID=A0ABS6ZME3_9GAMM|nr:hypothetical protein [Halomonas antri]MBW6391244.1 hypothetical protein [Halomonas antri]
MIDLNQQARDRLTAVSECELFIVPGASHLFEEPGKLEEVERQAARFFLNDL